MQIFKRLTLIFNSMKFSHLILIIMLSVVNALLSILTIYAISKILSTNQLFDSSTFNYIPESYINFLTENMIIFVLISIILMVASGLVKNYFIFRLIAHMRHALSMSILKIFMLNPETVIGQNQGNLKTLVLEETQQVVKQLLQPIVVIASSSLFVLIISIFLFLTNPALTIVSLATVLLHFTFAYIFTSKRLQDHGRSRFENNQARYSKIDDFFNLFKLVYVMRPGSFFLNRFSVNSDKMAKSQYLFDSIAHAPRVILEGVIFIIVIFIYTAQSSSNGININVSIFDLSIIIMAALKIAPEAQKIFHAFGLLKFGSTTQNVITALLTQDSLPISTSKTSNLKQVNVQFDACYRGENRLFQNVDLNFSSGDRIALIGASGVGKTTLIECIMGIMPVKINNINSRLQLDLKFGYLPQETFLFTGTILDNIKLGTVGAINDEILFQYAKQLFPEINQIKEFLNREVEDISSTLSVGQKQRIGLLRAVFSKPDFIILDEFTSALDIKSEKLVVDFIEANFKKAVIIIIGHRKDSMLICNQTLKIENKLIFKI